MLNKKLFKYIFFIFYLLSICKSANDILNYVNKFLLTCRLKLKMK